MSVYDLRTSPPPTRTAINNNSGLFGNIWTRWLTDYYSIVESKLSLAIVMNGILNSTITPISISNSNTETVLISATINSNSVQTGTVFIIKCFGLVSTHSVSPILTLRCRMGSTTLLGNILTEFIISCNSGIISQFFLTDIIVSVRTIGSTGTIISNGIIQNSFSSSALVSSANTATSSFDSTATNLIEFTAQFNNAHSSNVLSLQNGIIEVKNSIVA